MLTNLMEGERRMNTKILLGLMLVFASLNIMASCGGGGGGGGENYNWDDNPELTASIPDPLDGLTDKAKQAVELAPNWLKYDLIDNLRRFASQKQDDYSELIINPGDERYRDELAFLVAHTSPGDITGLNLSPELLMDNVATAYANDEELDYVQILDVTEKDGDYYSTVKYAMPDGATLELPREYYYWFIIHERLEDESPAYINPETGGAADPPDGVFWRDYYFTHADADCRRNENCENYNPAEEPYACPVLRDMLQDAQYMWEGHTVHSLDEFNASVEGTGALEIVTQWIMQVMHWGAHPSRPIQPVRIYHFHCGRCGEHADISDAAARTALLPAVNVSALPNDHVWNEFFDNDFYELGTIWHQWEPVNWFINNFSSYDLDPDESGWWPMYAAFATRGDGYVFNRTPDYSKTCTIKANVKDSRGKPVDGALVTIYGKKYGMFLPNFAQLTDRNGKVEALVGEGNYTTPYPLRYYMSVKSKLGNWPDGDPEPVVNMPNVGDVINVDVQLSNAADYPPLEDKEPGEGAGRYTVKLTYNLGQVIMYGTSIIAGVEFSDERDKGWSTLLILDRDNYEKFANGKPFSPTAIKKLSGEGTYEFDVPRPECWYFLVLNDSVNATQVGTMKFELLRDGKSKLSRDDELFLKAEEAATYQLCGL